MAPFARCFAIRFSIVGIRECEMHVLSQAFCKICFHRNSDDREGPGASATGRLPVLTAKIGLGNTTSQATFPNRAKRGAFPGTGAGGRE